MPPATVCCRPSRALAPARLGWHPRTNGNGRHRPCHEKGPRAHGETAFARRDVEPVENIDLAQVLDFRPDQGIIRFHQQRVVILSAAAMGLLRKELIATLGPETARRLMLRFGYADGYHDAVSLRDRSTWADPLEGLRAGAVLHRLEGIVRTEIVSVEHDAASGRFEEEVQLVRLVRGRTAHAPLRQERGAGVLVPRGLCERVCKRLSWPGGVLPGNGVRRARRARCSVDRSRR